MQNELSERQSKRTPGGREEGREETEEERPNRKQRKIVAIYATNRKRWKLQDENEARKVYAKQQTKQSRQLICWQRKGESPCPNIHSIYKAGHTGHTHTARDTQETGYRTWDMGKQFRACWQRKFTCQKTSRWTNSVGESRRGLQRGGEWSNILRFLFN